jgi:hypothetical protein
MQAKVVDVILPRRLALHHHRHVPVETLSPQRMARRERVISPLRARPFFSVLGKAIPMAAKATRASPPPISQSAPVQPPAPTLLRDEVHRASSVERLREGWDTVHVGRDASAPEPTSFSVPPTQQHPSNPPPRADNRMNLDLITSTEFVLFQDHMRAMQASLQNAVNETMNHIAAAQNSLPLKVVKNEVPVEVVKIVERPVEIEKVVTKEVAVPVEVETSIVVEKPTIKEVFVDRVVQHEVPVPYDKVVVREVPMPFEVERVVEKIIEKEVPVYVEQMVLKEVPTPIEKIVYKEVEVPVEKIVQVLKSEFGVSFSFHS